MISVTYCTYDKQSFDLLECFLNIDAKDSPFPLDSTLIATVFCSHCVEINSILAKSRTILYLDINSEHNLARVHPPDLSPSTLESAIHQPPDLPALFAIYNPNTPIQEKVLVGYCPEQDKMKSSLLVLLLVPARGQFITPFLPLNGLFATSSVRSDMTAYRVSFRRATASEKGKGKDMPVDVMERARDCVDHFGKYDLEDVEDMRQGESQRGRYFLCVSRSCCLDGFNDCVRCLCAFGDLVF